jgi:hypothetical protein
MGRSNAGPSERPQKRDRSDEPTCPVSREGEGGTPRPNVDVLPVRQPESRCSIPGSAREKRNLSNTRQQLDVK